MKVYALLAWFDESPETLTRCVESLAGFADHFIGLDGSYESWPNPRRESPALQAFALSDAVRRAHAETGMRYSLWTPHKPWASEVEKRATMFEHARECGATPDDWLLVIDADVSVAHAAPATRDLLTGTGYDVAEVKIHNVRPDGHVSMTYPRYRSMFRALPGLTCKWTHWLYVAPLEVGWRYMWKTPNGHDSAEPVLDLSEHVTLHHHNLDRSAERDAAARTYYRNREAQQLERAPHH